jgi:hypothetical protein
MGIKKLVFIGDNHKGFVKGEVYSCIIKEHTTSIWVIRSGLSHRFHPDLFMEISEYREKK